MVLRQFLISFILFCTFVLNALATVRFAHISDLHIFEDAKRASETKISANDFQKAINEINRTSDLLKKQSKAPLEFVVVTGDIGIGKLLKVDGVTGKLSKDPRQWNQAKEFLANIMKESKIKRWLFLPGNNDLYKERDGTVGFYKNFLSELQERPEIKNADLSIVDFRLDASQAAQSISPPGTYQTKDFLFIGWDNAYFKNNNSIKSFISKDHKVIPFTRTREYQSLQKLSHVLNTSKAKYAYIIYHIPEIDDPYLVRFDASKESNPAFQRLKEANELSPTLAKEVYPYSAWTVPWGVRDTWENIVTNRVTQSPLIKGLFAGHFHDHKKYIYSTTSWNKTKKYNPQILKKLYIAPPVSIKNQSQYPPSQQARGGQIITIDDSGDVTRDFLWFDQDHSSSEKLLNLPVLP